MQHDAAGNSSGQHWSVASNSINLPALHSCASSLSCAKAKPRYSLARQLGVPGTKPLLRVYRRWRRSCNFHGLRIPLTIYRQFETNLVSLLRYEIEIAIVLVDKDVPM